LSFLEEAVKNSEASSQNLAYLIDRVRTNQGKLQLYGTQWANENGKLILQPVENPDLLDERRKEMNLPTIEEYKKSTMEGYKLSEDAFK